MLTFQEAIDSVDKDSKPSIILANGFSQAWNAEIFNYANLLDAADFGNRDKVIRPLFEYLETYDFEIISKQLTAAETVLRSYDHQNELIACFASDRAHTRGHPLAGLCQESKRFHGGNSRLLLISLNSRYSYQTAPVFSNSGYERIAPVTHQDQANNGELLSPWRLCRPRKTLVPLRVQWLSQTHGYRLPGSNPWLAHVAGDPLLLLR